MVRSARYRSGLVWALGIGLVMAWLCLRGALSGLEWRAYDLQLAARTPAAPQSDIVIIIIDDACLDRLGRWPWPLHRHAELVRRLASAQPRAIVFDLLFFGGSGAGTAEFARALRQAGNVYLATCFLEQERPLRAGRHWVRMSQMRAPPQQVVAAAAGVGAVNVFPERDGVVRAAPLLLEYRGRPFPSLALQVARDMLGAGKVRLPLRRQRDPFGKLRAGPFGKLRAGPFGKLRAGLRLGHLTIPLNAAGEMLISYAGAYRCFTMARYDDVLAGRVAPEHFRNRIVLIGFSATGLSDTRPTPLSPACPGVEINAHALHTILRGDFIHPLGGPGNALLALGAALALGLVLPRLRPLRALGALVAGIAAALAIIAVGIYLFRAAGLWVNVVTPALAAVMVGLVIAGQGYRASEEEQIRLESRVGALALATRMIAASTSRAPLLEAIREEITQLASARRTDIYLVDEEAQNLVLVGGDAAVRLPLADPATDSASSEPALSAAKGQARSAGSGQAAPGAGGTLGQVARDGVPLVSDASADPDLAREVARAADFAVGPVAFVPLRRHGQVIGVAQVARELQGAPFGERDLELLNALSQEAVVALENVELYEKLEGKVELANRELVRAYSQLELEKDRVDALLENMADGVIMTDLEERVLYVNPAAERMFGVSAGEAAGTPLVQHLPISGLPAIIAAARAQPGRLASGQLTVERPRRLVLTANSALIADDRGQAVGVVTVLSDVTLLQELSDMKTEFVSLVSHELRTPLTSIQGFAQTLRSDAQGHFDAEARGEFLEIIESECYRLLSMINELLDASRIEAGRALPMNWGQVNLPEVVERVVKLQAGAAPQHRFEADFPPDFPGIDADPDRIEQVLTNIISNAIKYSPDGGRVRISGAVGAHGGAPPGQVLVAVADEGLGMTQAQMAQLFQRYHRVESDASKRIRGTGLGLYLTKGLVEAHGGRIWAHSAGPGQGSQFSFVLPIKRVEKTAEETAAPTGP